MNVYHSFHIIYGFLVIKLGGQFSDLLDTYHILLTKIHILKTFSMIAFTAHNYIVMYTSI